MPNDGNIRVRFNFVAYYKSVIICTVTVNLHLSFQNQTREDNNCER